MQARVDSIHAQLDAQAVGALTMTRFKFALAGLVAGAAPLVAAPAAAQADRFDHARHWIEQRFQRASNPSLRAPVLPRGPSLQRSRPATRVAVQRSRPATRVAVQRSRPATRVAVQRPNPATYRQQQLRHVAHRSVASYARPRLRRVSHRPYRIVYRPVIQRVYIARWPFFLWYPTSSTERHSEL